MSLLQKIHTGKKQQPPRLLIYGSEGVGKSTLAAKAPNPIFIPTEDGLDVRLM
ncbi:MAG: ATP-binding protein [Planctomycetaceae bacterium]|nr:ATP-binding protein [Planctomycetaceae bacterium]